jgi:hypothetical protein
MAAAAAAASQIPQPPQRRQSALQLPAALRSPGVVPSMWEGPLSTHPSGHRQVTIHVSYLGSRAEEALTLVTSAMPAEVSVGSSRMLLRYVTRSLPPSEWRDFAFHRRELGVLVVVDARDVASLGDFSAQMIGRRQVGTGRKKKKKKREKKRKKKKKKDEKKTKKFLKMKKKTTPRRE